MPSLTRESLAELLAPDSAPCVSVYQPTHRRHPENESDPIRFRNLVKQAKASLLQAHSTETVQLILKRFHALADDHDFWNKAQDGLAVLGTPDSFHVFRLPRPVSELVVVADRFNVKPLWQFLQSIDRYQVLALSLDRVRLFEGDRDGLEEVTLADGIQRVLTDTRGAEAFEPHQTVASYGGVGGATNAMHHGQGGKSAQADTDAERLFRATDRAILEHHSRPSGLPLILAALPEHHHQFHAVSHNPFLLPQGIKLDVNSVTADGLRTLAWKVVEPDYEARLTRVTNEFEQARADGRGSDILPQIAEAAAQGRVATLFIDAEREIGGHYDRATGKIVGGSLDNPHVDDALNGLGLLVGKMGGEVFVIPAERMPTRRGAAAIYRY